jgi:urea transport system substrate-binding protein
MSDPSKPRAEADTVVQGRSEMESEDRPSDPVDLVSLSGLKPAPGMTVARYRLLRRLGVGGMGIVFEAEDTQLKRKVALKFLRSGLSVSQQSLERFTREAQAACQIDHPHAVATYDVGEIDGLRYVVLELLDPRSAKHYVDADGPLHWTEATRIVLGACRALAAAHAVGMVHRDIKPDNFLRSRKGVVKLTDFGLAKHVEADIGLTSSGTLLGTPLYMSPEQCQGERVDGRSDIYSMGASFYTLLVGHRPFQEATKVADVLVAHCYDPVPDPGDDDPTLPEAVRAIVRTAMAKKAADRYQTVDEMIVDLEAALGEAGVEPEPRFLRAPEPIASSSGATSGSAPAGSGRGDSGGAMNTPRSGTEGRGLTATSPTAEQPGVVSRRSALAGIGLASIAAGLAVWFSTRPEDDEVIVATASQGVAASAPPNAPIPIGVLHSLSGTMAISEKSVVDATLLAVDEINAKGGVLGRLLQPVVADGRSDWPTFAKEAERLIEKERVAVVFGGWTSASRKTMLPVFERLDHLLFYPVQYEGLEQSRNIVYTGAAPNQQILPVLKWCSGYLGARRFFLVGSDYVFPRTANAIMRDALVADGKEVVGEEYVLLGSSDVAGVVAKIEAAAPDVILNTINGDTNVAFFRTLRRTTTSKQRPVVSFSIGEDELRQITDVSLAGDYLAWNYFQSVDRPENEAFVASFQKKYGSYRVTTDPMEAAYFGVHLWALAAEKAGKPDPASVRPALHGMTYAAPSAKVTIDPETQHTWKVFRLGRITETGTVDMVFGTESPIKPEPFPASRSREAWQTFLSDLYEGWGKSWANPGR